MCTPQLRSSRGVHIQCALRNRGQVGARPRFWAWTVGEDLPDPVFGRLDLCREAHIRCAPSNGGQFLPCTSTVHRATEARSAGDVQRRRPRHFLRAVC